MSNLLKIQQPSATTSRPRVPSIDVMAIAGVAPEEVTMRPAAVLRLRIHSP